MNADFDAILNPDDLYKNVLDLGSLRPGDILTFEGEETDIISRLIMKFTHSRVTHGALYLTKDPVSALADAGSDGIHAHKADFRENSRNAYVCRLTKKESSAGAGSFFPDEEISAVTDAAKLHIKEGLPYPYSDLVLLALILIFKDVSREGVSQKFILGVLKLAAVQIKKLIDEKFHDGKHTMVCSSYVYQCYFDASAKNRDLKIELEGADLGILRGEKKVNTLFELYAEHAREYNYRTELFARAAEEPLEESLEDILQEGLKESDRVLLVKNNVLSGCVENFLKVLLQAAGKAFEGIEELIREAREMQALFVTPNDLCFHIANAEKIGKITLYRNAEILEEYEP